MRERDREITTFKKQARLRRMDLDGTVFVCVSHQFSFFSFLDQRVMVDSREGVCVCVCVLREGGGAMSCGQFESWDL